MHLICSARYLVINGNGVLKVIPKFQAFAKQMETELAAIQRAYQAANSTDNLADPCLIVAQEGPELHKTTYRVLAGPLGYCPIFEDEKVSMSTNVCLRPQCRHKTYIHRLC